MKQLTDILQVWCKSRVGGRNRSHTLAPSFCSYQSYYIILYSHCLFLGNYNLLFSTEVSLVEAENLGTFLVAGGKVRTDTSCELTLERRSLLAASYIWTQVSSSFGVELLLFYCFKAF